MRSVVFASGLTTNPTDMGNALREGKPVGVAVWRRISANVKAKLIRATDMGLPIFLDSGAFQAFNRSIEIDWERVLCAYHDMITQASHPGLVYVVAPDVVGNHEATMELQYEWADTLNWMAQVGANVIIPVQRNRDGSGSLAIHWADLTDWIDTDYEDNFIIGVPFNKAAWKVEDVVGLIRKRGHARVHLLGGGSSKTRLIEQALELWGLEVDFLSGDSLYSGVSKRMKRRDKNGTTNRTQDQESNVGWLQEGIPYSA